MSPISKKHRRSHSQPMPSFHTLVCGQCAAAQLPAELWHRILSMVPPHDLVAIMAVNKRFNRYLDPLVTTEMIGSPVSRLALQSPDAIWQSSRRLFWPEMPAPPKGKHELDMWRLCCSRSCQFCGVIDGTQNNTETQDKCHRGPGSFGVTPVFAFFVVTCGECLEERTIKVSGNIVKQCS